MNKDDIVQYLANIILIGRSDGKLASTEDQALDIVLIDLGAHVEDFNQAMEMIKGGYKKIKPVGRLSDQVRNLEDMVFVSLADGELPGEEKKIISAFAQRLELSQKHVARILSESRRRVKKLSQAVKCPSCLNEAAVESKFCPFCGTKLK